MITARHEDALFRIVGQRIRRARKAHSLTQQELARLISLSRTSVTNIELGQQRIPLYQLLSVADALDHELHDLLPTRAELGITGALGEPVDLPIVGDMTPSAKSVLARLSRSRSAE